MWGVRWPTRGGPPTPRLVVDVEVRDPPDPTVGVDLGHEQPLELEAVAVVPAERGEGPIVADQLDRGQLEVRHPDLGARQGRVHVFLAADVVADRGPRRWSDRVNSGRRRRAPRHGRRGRMHRSSGDRRAWRGSRRRTRSRRGVRPAPRPRRRGRPRRAPRARRSVRTRRPRRDSAGARRIRRPGTPSGRGPVGRPAPRAPRCGRPRRRRSAHGHWRRSPHGRRSCRPRRPNGGRG